MGITALEEVYKQLKKVNIAWRKYRKTRTQEDYSAYRLQLTVYQLMHDEWYNARQKEKK